MSNTILLPFQPDSMTPAQLAAVSYLARYSGHTHGLYAYQLRRWFGWCETNRLDPLEGIQRAHVELYIRHLGESGLRPSSINTMLHGVRGFFRFAHIDGLIPSDPAVYARLPKVHQDESRTQGLHWVGKGSKPATMALTCPVLRVLEARRAERMRRATGPPPPVRAADRPTRLLPDGHPDRQSRRDPAPHQPTLPAACGHHQRPGRWRAAARCPDPGPACRPPHHRALRPRPRQPRPTRRSLPHRLRRGRVSCCRSASFRRSWVATCVLPSKMRT